ncbi:MAG: TIGR02466 family protein [Pseudomonadota bacterium]
MTLAKPDIDSALSQIFSTPLVLYDWPGTAEMNAGLTSAIEALMAGSGGVTKSNVGGWHSALDFLYQSDVPAIAVLNGAIQQIFTALIPHVLTQPPSGKLGIAVEGWANCLKAGEYNSLHAHPNAAWSGVYFITGIPSGGDANGFGGKLEFVDPRPGASIMHTDSSALSGRCLVTPQPGRMALFPGWLQHFVHPFSAPGQRMSVAFNIFLRES